MHRIAAAVRPITAPLPRIARCPISPTSPPRRLSTQASLSPMTDPAPPPLPRRPLGSTGMEVSVLSFGAAPLGGVYQEVTEAEHIAAVEAAFARGINFFDTSPYYGATKSETVLGKALARLPRDQIIVATKCGRYGPETFDFSAERINASVRESLDRLGLEYVDILHCHDIEFGDLDQIVNETLPALAALKKEGLIRAIGITGLPLKIYRYVLDRAPPGAVDVILSYCHHHLADSTLVDDILPYLQSKGVGVINASPLSMGLLTPQGPPEWHPAPVELQAAARAAAAAAAACDVSLPKLGVMHAVQHPGVATTLVGICGTAQVHENCDAALQALDLVPNPDAEKEEKAMEGVREALAAVQNLTWASGRPENN